MWVGNVLETDIEAVIEEDGAVLGCLNFGVHANSQISLFEVNALRMSLINPRNKKKNSGNYSRHSGQLHSCIPQIKS